MQAVTSLQLQPSTWVRRAVAAAIALALAGGVAAAAVVEPAAAALALFTAAAVLVAWRQPEWLLAVWIGASPWASYWLRYPAERSIVTFDRVAVTALVAGLVAREWTRRGRPAPPTFVDATWLAFAGVAVANALLLSDEKGLGLRTAVDAFLLPGLLFYALRTCFDAAKGRRALFWAVAALAVSLPWTGLYEFATATDVMPFKGSSLFRTGIVRANGPFATDNSYAIVSALAGVFLVWLPAVTGFALDRAARLARRVAIGCAFLAALVPVFRTIIGAIGVALALPYAAAGRVRVLARAAVVALLLAIAALPVMVPLTATATFQDRISDPSSAFSRVATYLAAIDLIGDHPYRGVGLYNYKRAFDQKFGTAWYIDVEAVENVGAEAYPHNNVLGLWAELGVAGVFLYLASSMALAGLAWRRRNMAALALMAVYWIAGMTLYSCVYADLNLAYYAMLGVALGETATGSLSPPARQVR